jgi:hypothetical protein
MEDKVYTPRVYFAHERRSAAKSGYSMKKAKKMTKWY